MKILATMIILSVSGLWLGCAPGIQGGWAASGHMGTADAFDLDLTFESDEKGLAVYATVDEGEKAVPVCQTTVVEQQVSFVIDTAGGNTCSTLTRPLSFQGQLGHDVITGTISDAAGEQIGIWRAYRKGQK